MEESVRVELKFSRALGIPEAEDVEPEEGRPMRPPPGRRLPSGSHPWRFMSLDHPTPSIRCGSHRTQTREEPKNPFAHQLSFKLVGRHQKKNPLIGKSLDRDRRHSEKRRKTVNVKPQEDLRDHLNRKAASRNLYQEPSSSYHSPPEEQEDLRDVLWTQKGERKQPTPALRISQPDVGLMKEELMQEILSDLLKEVQGEGRGDRRRATCPFSEEIMAAPFPPEFKMPNIPSYNGHEDPVNHVDSFKTWMDFMGVTELARCRAFPLTLSRSEQASVGTAALRSITSFF
ncbi:hypothetical protein FNV43_RR09710 [Rhamnella rubrinervis]|uniref:Uncharacterized protein n=1 Tax=Rhamnella rubrinervis TaxID=2594499 RepID=A0A8K0MK15_9ROSA|nr:hypothetical protein FNV43_RR09710 [Rhamnella rubrinervis]